MSFQHQQLSISTQHERSVSTLQNCRWRQNTTRNVSNKHPSSASSVSVGIYQQMPHLNLVCECFPWDGAIVGWPAGQCRDWAGSKQATPDRRPKPGLKLGLTSTFARSGLSWKCARSKYARSNQETHRPNEASKHFIDNPGQGQDDPLASLGSTLDLRRGPSRRPKLNFLKSPGIASKSVRTSKTYFLTPRGANQVPKYDHDDLLAMLGSTPELPGGPET